MTPREFAVHVVDSFQMYGPWNAPDIMVYRDYSSDTVAAIADQVDIPIVVEVKHTAARSWRSARASGSCWPTPTMSASSSITSPATRWS